MDGTITMDGAIAQNRIYVQIVEEPAPKALRFRYECEGRSAGSLPGTKSTTDKKTFPKIQIVGHTGRAVVVVSCVTLDPPYRPHPHNLVGKEGCKKGVCTMEIANDDMTCEFSNLGIQCVKKKDIEDSLKVREEIRVDPYRTGFSHKTQPGSIDLNSVRLCFQVFLEGPERGQFKIPLKAIVSEPIYDKKAINDLTIMKMSDCTSPVIGNKEIILLCDKVSKDDIEVRFFEEQDGAVVWEAFGDFQPSDVHKQFAICFRTPQYRNLEITNPSRVYIQLRCPSKDTTSIPRPFDYIPLSSDVELIKRKRQKLAENNSQRLAQYFTETSSGSGASLIKQGQRVSSYPPLQNSGQQTSPNHQQQHQQSLPPFSGPHTQLPTQIKQEQPDYNPFHPNVIGFSGGGLLQQQQQQQQQHQTHTYFPPQHPLSLNPPSNSSIQHRSPTNNPGSISESSSSSHNNFQGQQQQQQQQHLQQGLSPSSSQDQQQRGNESNNNNVEIITDDFGNISLPNLSDVNLSLLENHLSENFNSNLVLDPDVQALGMAPPTSNIIPMSRLGGF